MGSDLVLYDYWRSSASYRVRIALNLLEQPHESRQINLLTRDHKSDTFLTLNPQGALPALTVGDKTLTQSLAIIEYLHATVPGSTLLPSALDGQYRTRQLSYAIAMEIHPVCNLSVAAHVALLTGEGDETKKHWMQHFIGQGLDAFEALLKQGGTGNFCCGDLPTMADCCLIPQLYNADRWGVQYSHHVEITRIAETARAKDAFARAHPDQIGPPKE
jgi:maleylacetoacetate isomerase